MSDERKKRFDFIWEIENFSLNLKKCGEILKSPVFTVETFGGSKWMIDLYPLGQTKRYKGYISLFLRKIADDVYSTESKVSYEVSVFGKDQQVLTSPLVEDHVFVNNDTWGWFALLATKNITDKLRNLNHDVLTIRCEMSCSCIPTPQSRAVTVIGVDRCSFLWNARIPDNNSDITRYEFAFSNQSIYEIRLCTRDDGSVQVCIVLKDESHFPKYMTCNLSLVNTKGDAVASKPESHFFEMDNKNETWDIPSLTTRKFLESNKSTLIKNNEISLFCEFATSNGKVSSSLLDSNHESVSDVNAKLVLHNELKDMLSNHLHCDMKLKVDSEIVQAHKSILAARSPVFASMFEQEMIEVRTGIVEISDLNIDTLKLFLEFIYTGSLDKMEYEQATKLIFAADKYQIATLVEKCARFLESDLSLKNCCELLIIADMIGHERLKNIIINFIARNSTKILKSPEWLEIVKNNAKLAGEMFSNIADIIKFESIKINTE